MDCARLGAAVAAALLLASCASAPPPKPAPPAKTTAKPSASKPATKGSAATKQAKGSAPAAPTPPAKVLSPDERYDQALQQMKANDLAGAEQNLRQSVLDFPNKTGPHTNLGIVYAKTHRRKEAAAEFMQAVNISSGNAAAHNWLGVLARERGEYVRAEQWYKQAIAADSSYADAQLNLAILYEQYLKRPADALEAYRRYDKLTRGKDIRAPIWIAELQAQLPPAAAAQPAPPVPVKVPPPAQTLPKTPPPTKGASKS
jgi:Tfp pilus assembly protein PilF